MYRLRRRHDDADPPIFDGVDDDLLTEPQVRQIMEYYLAVRIRRYGRAFQPDGTSSATSTERGATTRPPGTVRQMSSSGGPVGVGSVGIRPVIRSTGRDPGRY